jgi:hypothetical protein
LRVDLVELELFDTWDDAFPEIVEVEDDWSLILELIG